MNRNSNAALKVIVILLFGFFLYGIAWSATYDATGTWTYTTTDNWTNPGTAECPPEPNHTWTATITQTGDNVVVEVATITYTGTVSGDTYTVSTSYSEDGGTTVENVTFTLSSDSSGSGVETWSWSGGGYACNGGCNISLTKQQTSPPTSDYTGWWYKPEEWGSGISIEIQDDDLFMVWYSYDLSGRPVWYSSGGKMTTQNTYSGTLLEWTGWPLGSDSTDFQSSAVGTVAVTFTFIDQALMTWTYGTDQGIKSIRKFMNDIASGDKDSRDIHGWWWDPNFSGMGLFFEAQGGTIFLAWYNYRNDSTTRWWSAGGDFPNGTTTYTGNFQEWTNGQCIGGDYASPLPSGAPGGFTLQFVSDSTATFTFNGSTYNLQRFLFGELQ